MNPDAVQPARWKRRVRRFGAEHEELERVVGDQRILLGLAVLLENAGDGGDVRQLGEQVARDFGERLVSAGIGQRSRLGVGGPENQLPLGVQVERALHGQAALRDPEACLDVHVFRDRGAADITCRRTTRDAPTGARPAGWIDVRARTARYPPDSTSHSDTRRRPPPDRPAAAARPDAAT